MAVPDNDIWEFKNQIIKYWQIFVFLLKHVTIIMHMLILYIHEGSLRKQQHVFVMRCLVDDFLLKR